MAVQPLIGIVGGMGPHAGLRLAELIHASTRAATDQDHLAVALLSRPGDIPDRSVFLNDPSAPDPAPVIGEIACQLADLGATVIGIPCNTAHAPAIFDRVSNQLERHAPGVRLLHLIEETVRMIDSMRPRPTRIGLLSTLGTYRTGIYTAALSSAGYETILPDETAREHLVNRAIYDPVDGIKACSSPATPNAIARLEAAATHLQGKGAQAVILGCTELSLAVPGEWIGGLPIVDSTRALALALIRAVAPGRLQA